MRDPTGGSFVDLVVYGVASFNDPVGSCFDRTATSGLDADLRYDGPINTRRNIVPMRSSDGSCTGGALGAWTVVRARDLAGASVLCQQLTDLSNVAGSLNGLGYLSAPADFSRRPPL